jgi:hypothetical protein
VANAAAGVIVQLVAQSLEYDTSLAWVDGPDASTDSERDAEWRAARFRQFVLSGGTLR